MAPICAQLPTVARGVHHRAGSDMGAQVDEAGHQDGARRDIGAAAHDAGGHGAEAGRAPSASPPSTNLLSTLSPPAAALRAARLQAHVLHAKA